MILAAVGVVPALTLAALVEFAFFTRMAHLMTHSAIGPTAVLRGGLRLGAAASGGLQFLGAGVACALIARAVRAQQPGRKPVPGPLVAVLLLSVVFVGVVFAVASAVGTVAAFFVCLAPVAVAMDGGTALSGFRKGVSAAFKAPVGTVLVVGFTALALIMLDVLRLGFSASAAQHGSFSFGVQGAAAVMSTAIVPCAGVALTLLYQRTAGRNRATGHPWLRRAPALGPCPLRMPLDVVSGRRKQGLGLESLTS